MKGKAATRTAIVDAALACALQDGWEATSLQEVRQRAGVSNGTLFHHFPRRAELATAVVAAGLADQQDALVHELRGASTPAGGVSAVVLRHLRWVEDNQQLARLLLAASPEVLRGGLDATALTANRDFFTEVDSWLRSAGWPGVPDLAVVAALWIGPSQEYARGWLAAPDTPLAAAAGALANGAWHTLRPLLKKGEPDELGS